MKIKQLIQKWESDRTAPPTEKTFNLQLSATDAAKIMALSELFPTRTEHQIVSELIAATLNEIEEAFPYVQGTKVIRVDEFNDPIYEDIGLTPKFEQLMRKHLTKLRDQDDESE